MEETTTYNITADISPEKLAMARIKEELENGDTFSDTGSVINGGRRSLGFEARLNGGATSRSMGRSRQMIRSSSRRSSSFISAHRSKMSMELTTQAETKFLALMDLMANASREAASLREFWGRIIAEREAYASEKEELEEQITEISQELELRNTERQKHGNDSIESRKHTEKLLLDLSTAVSNVAAQKKIVAERDLELVKIRRELTESRETHVRSRTDLEKVRKEFELLQLAIKTVEGDRDSARVEAEQHHKDLQRVTRERVEFSSKLTDITSKYEISLKETLSLADRIKLYESEHEEHIHEALQLKEEARKAKTRADDAARELLEITEKLEKISRETTKHKETIRVLESERDESNHIIEHLRRDLKAANAGREEADDKVSELSLKLEHTKRDVLSVKDKLRNVELERDEHHDSLETIREQHRVIVIERDELRDDISTAHRRADDARRQVTDITESLRKAESSLTEVRSEVFSLTDRVKHADIERDDWRNKHNLLLTEISQLKESIVVFKAEIRTVKEHRDRVEGELQKVRQQYLEVKEEIVSYGDDSHELEFEIESLRTMLREVREQKESAITARHTADRERDEAIARYEEKCREMERFEESAASHYHAHGRSEGHSRIVSRSTTTMNNRSSSHD